LDHVRVINTGDRLLPFADAEVATMLHQAMASIGVEFLMPQHVAKIDGRDAVSVVLQDGRRLETEAVLVALGRQSIVEGLGLDRAGLRLNAHGQLEVNERFQTNVPHIYAAGDVIGGLALSSTAMEQARIAMVNAFDLSTRPALRGTCRSVCGPSPSYPWWGRRRRACARRRAPTSSGAVGTSTTPAGR
jgi:pyruvate/2-oxoglutarate dehydrogenase complex dihydrolipoamide dehydrogenase (E3) component